MNYYAAKINDKGNIAVDDTILVKDVEASAGSEILKGYKPLFSAEAVDRLENSGYTVAGKTHVGEFGLDLAGEYSSYAEKQDTVKGAATELIKNGGVKAALGVDVNGAPRRAAALSGVSFLKPTYGTVSRYGVISTAASGEQIGVYAENSAEICKIMGVIAGHDDKDGTSLPDEKYDFSADENVSGKRVAVVSELLNKADDETKARVNAAADKLRKKGAAVEEISCRLFETANIAWQILMCAEACNNLSRYDGVKFGRRSENYRNIDELYVNSRTEGLNFLTKSVILYGSDVLSKNRYNDCYAKSLKVRRVVSDEFKKLYQSYDVILTPACGKTAFEQVDISGAFERVFNESEFTAAANLIGTPALVTGGVQLLGNHFSESLLFGMANALESEEN